RAAAARSSVSTTRTCSRRARLERSDVWNERGPARAPQAGGRSAEAALRSVVVLAGGVGGGAFLGGGGQWVEPEALTAIVNTGDDRVFYGVHVSPDIDIVTYTLAGRIDPARGFGLAGDRFTLIERLHALGHETWFRLG